VTDNNNRPLNSTQLKFIRNTVARRLKDTHENNGDKQTNKTIKRVKTMNEHHKIKIVQ